MKLEVYRTLFYRLTKTGEVEFARDAVTELLNMGWKRAAEDTGGILALYKEDLVEDQETYELSGDVITVDKVEVYSASGDLRVTLKPEYAPDLELKENELTPGTPSRCSWKIQKRGSATAKFELRLMPAADWDETDGLWVTARVRPKDLTDSSGTGVTGDETEPDALANLGMAGLYWACYLATQKRTWNNLYWDEIKTFRKSGIVSQPVVKRNPYNRSGSGGNWNVYVNER